MATKKTVVTVLVSWDDQVWSHPQNWFWQGLFKEPEGLRVRTLSHFDVARLDVEPTD